MSVLSGYQKVNRYIKQSSGYKKLSQWTSSNSVQMDDGKTLQANLGNIKGITSSLATTNANYALSASAGKSLQDQITTLNNGLGSLSSITKAQVKTTINGASATIDLYRNKVGVVCICITCISAMSYEDNITSAVIPTEWRPNYPVFLVARASSSVSYSTEYGTTSYEIQADGRIHILTRDKGILTRNATGCYLINL